MPTAAELKKKLDDARAARELREREEKEAEAAIEAEMAEAAKKEEEDERKRKEAEDAEKAEKEQIAAEERATAAQFEAMAVLEAAAKWDAEQAAAKTAEGSKASTSKVPIGTCWNCRRRGSECVRSK